MARARVLIVEDETDIANLVQFHLTKEGFSSEVALSGRMALRAVDQSRPDLVILDIMLPDLDGLEVCRKLKRDAATQQIPILMVSARGEESDIVVGLELGAEDYVTKPFSPRVLMARVKAVLRRRDGDSGQELVLDGGRVRIDSERHSIEIDGERVDLTLTQFRLFQFLALRPGFVRTRDQIVAAVRGHGTVLSGRAIDVHVAALRQKLGDRADLVETVRGVGYRMAADRAGVPV